MNKNFVLVLGVQSSGKSTQSRLLADYLGYRFISTGKLLRRLSESNNPIGKRLSDYWTKGEFVPDELIEEILYPLIQKDTAKGFVIDGYPRNISQLQGFKSFLDMNYSQISNVFYIWVSQEEAFKRIKLRSQTEHRPDDDGIDGDVVKRRIALYHEQTEPLLKQYQEMGILRKINGENSIEVIFDEIKTFFPSKS